MRSVPREKLKQNHICINNNEQCDHDDDDGAQIYYYVPYMSYCSLLTWKHPSLSFCLVNFLLNKTKMKVRWRSSFPLYFTRFSLIISHSVNTVTGKGDQKWRIKAMSSLIVSFLKLLLCVCLYTRYYHVPMHNFFFSGSLEWKMLGRLCTYQRGSDKRSERCTIYFHFLSALISSWSFKLRAGVHCHLHLKGKSF